MKIGLEPLLQLMVLPLDSLFDCIFVINLDTRTDRWNSVSEHLKRVGIHAYTRVSATHLNFDSTISKVKLAQISCFHSHLKTLRRSKEQGFRKILILEDDCIFGSEIDKSTVDMNSFMQSRPWDILYLGVNLRIYQGKNFHHNATVTRVDTGVVEIDGGGTSHAIAYNHSFLQAICDEYPNDEVFFQQAFSLQEHKCVYDVFLNAFTKSRNIRKYCLYPILCVQANSYSDIQFCQTSYMNEMLESWRAVCV